MLGKHTGRDVYRIDLSLVTSKYIGETEKNLARIFDQAKNKNWILFFDEADALFGKRTEISDAHDRYANQEVSYLLQRIEDHDGVVVLASNMKENLDDAFTRRFESIIHFPMPRPEQRLQIWRNGFSAKSTLSPEVDLVNLAGSCEISGGAIMNVIRYSSMKALSRGSGEILLADLQEGIRKELLKEGRTI
jgi:SpoVK/Ycf46/Vps4 family AAA+-type ATPase